MGGVNGKVDRQAIALRQAAAPQKSYTDYRAGHHAQGRPHLTEYKLTDAFFTELGRKPWAIRAPLLVAALALALWVAHLTAPLDNADWSFLLMIALFSAALTFVGYHTERDAWRSYRLMLDSEGVQRIQEDQPDVRVPYGEIRKIVEVEGQRLRIEAGSPPRLIEVPRALENYDEVRATLATRHPIETIGGTRARLLAWRFEATVAGYAGGTTLFFISKDARIVAILGIVLAAILIIGAVGTQRFVPRGRLKWLTWMILVIMDLAVFGERILAAIRVLLANPAAPFMGR